MLSPLSSIIGTAPFFNEASRACAEKSEVAKKILHWTP